MEIIAEIGQNHNGDMGLACDLIEAAHENGADVAKFQVYDAVGLFPPREANEWFDYNCKTELTRSQVEELARKCRDVGIEFMASAFDAKRVAWLDAVGVCRHKLASRSIGDRVLVEAMAASGKPVLVSLGMWGRPTFPDLAGMKAHFLYCISKYPTPLEDVHLADVDFNVYAGFSDHTLGLTAALAAMARGARIIEKHFTLDQNMYGPDHAGSMTPAELKVLSTYRADLKACL
jgi:sialic acid synthase SpsE